MDRPAGTELYFSFAQAPRTLSWVVVRTQGEPLKLTSAVRDAIRGLDRGLPISNIGSMEEVMSSARSRPRFLTLLLTMFSSLSLILAALGIYGVISYAVAQRTNEIGIRMALGARAERIRSMVLRQGLALAAIGTGFGITAAFFLAQILASNLFGVEPHDTLVFVMVPLILTLVAVAAVLIPSYRASRVDPLVALRHD